MKKYLYLALAMPMMFACSSDDLLEKGAVSNDQFSGIEKVDATFTMDEGQGTRMDKGSWEPEAGDLWGFAWLGDGTVINPSATGIAYQNHNLIQKANKFEPQTSIYVGHYFIYRPYDKETVSPQAINFKSLQEQTISEGFASTTQAWKDLAKTAINIGSKWTFVGGDIWSDGTTTWNEPGIEKSYKIYAAMFSNQTGLDVTYVKNKPSFTADQAVTGATDIDITYPAGSDVDAADIYSGSLLLAGAANAFTYAPKASPETEAHTSIPEHNGAYWADKSNLGAGEGFNFTISTGAIKFTAKDAENGIATGAEGSKAWFWLNTLPAMAGGATEATVVTPIFETSYGKVTAKYDYDLNTDLTVGNCAYAFNVEGGVLVFHPLSDAGDPAADPTVWKIGTSNTFINQYGNHRGKYTFNLDFSKGVMDKMHIINDTHLQKALKYYLASKKTEDVTLLLDKATGTNEFKISKISIALLQTINATPGLGTVKVKACDEVDGVASTAHTPERIIVTQVGSTDKTEVPDLNNVFATGTDVILASGTEWTWKEREAPAPNKLTTDVNVNSLTNEGTLTVNATNIELSAGGKIINAAGATMNITKLTTVKNTLTNLGTINVGAADNTSAELRAYDIEITNDATALGVGGTINNYGAVGVSDIGTSGKFNNYSVINVMNAGAITLLSTNEKVSNFDNHFDATTNKMGTVNLPSPTALVSVNNADANGFIKYTWPADTKTYVTPEGNVKYNTIVVSGDIQFTVAEAEIKYIEFNGTRTQVINNGGYLTLKGVMVNAGKSIIIEKGNTLAPANGTYLGAGATVYNGGTFTHNAAVVGTTASNYFGDWQTTQIVKY
jgi:hypothetical protein